MVSGKAPTSSTESRRDDVEMCMHTAGGALHFPPLLRDMFFVRWVGYGAGEAPETQDRG
jgi:hypothetical protein